MSIHVATTVVDNKATSKYERERQHFADYESFSYNLKVK